MPQLGGGSFKLASSILLFRLGRFGVGAQGALKVGEYTFAGGAAKHLASRPYYNSPLLIKEIIAGGKAIPDSAPGAIKYIAPGTFGNAKGNWELVIHEKTLTIYHFVFVGGK